MCLLAAQEVVNVDTVLPDESTADKQNKRIVLYKSYRPSLNFPRVKNSTKPNRLVWLMREGAFGGLLLKHSNGRRQTEIVRLC